MLCYRDRAWCSMSFPERGEARCINAECGRRASDDDVDRAGELGLAFSKMNFRGKGCGYRTAFETDAVPEVAA